MTTEPPLPLLALGTDQAWLDELNQRAGSGMGMPGEPGRHRIPVEEMLPAQGFCSCFTFGQLIVGI